MTNLLAAYRRFVTPACPACEQRVGVRKDISGARASVPAYKLSPVRLYCLGCGAQLQSHIRSSIWLPFSVWVAANGTVLCALFFGAMDQHMSKTELRYAGYAWLAVSYTWFQVIWQPNHEYRLVRNASPQSSNRF
jgi:hypothetical protein